MTAFTALSEALMIFMVKNKESSEEHTVNNFEIYMTKTAQEIMAMFGPDAQNDTPQKQKRSTTEGGDSQGEDRQPSAGKKKKAPKSTPKKKPTAMQALPVAVMPPLSQHTHHEQQQENSASPIPGDELNKTPQEYMKGCAQRTQDATWEAAMQAITGNDTLEILAHAMYAETAENSVNYNIQLELASTWHDLQTTPIEPYDWLGKQIWGLQSNLTQLDSHIFKAKLIGRGMEGCPHLTHFLDGLKQTTEMQVLTMGGRVLLRTSDANFATEQQDHFEDMIMDGSVRPHECIVLDSSTLPWESGAIHLTTYLHNRVINLLSDGGHAHIAITPHGSETSITIIHKIIESLQQMKSEITTKTIYFEQYMIRQPCDLTTMLYVSPDDALFGNKQSIMHDCEETILMLRIEVRDNNTVRTDSGTMEMCITGDHSTTAAMLAMQCEHGNVYELMRLCCKKTAPGHMRQYGTLEATQTEDEPYQGLSIAGWNLVWNAILDTATRAVDREYGDDTTRKPMLHTEGSIYVPQCSLENAFAAMSANMNLKLLFIELATDNKTVLTQIQETMTDITHEYITHFVESNSQVIYSHKNT